MNKLGYISGIGTFALIAVILAGPVEAQLAASNEADMRCGADLEGQMGNDGQITNTGRGLIRVGDTYYLEDDFCDPEVRDRVLAPRALKGTASLPNQGAGLVKIGDTYYLPDDPDLEALKSTNPEQDKNVSGGLVKIGDTYYFGDPSLIKDKQGALYPDSLDKIQDPEPEYVNDPYEGRYSDGQSVYLREGDFYVYSRTNLPKRYYDDYYLYRS